MRNKRLLAFFLLVINLLVTTMGVGVYASIPTNNFYVTYNGNLVTFQAGEGNFYIDSENRTQCPARKIAETMGYDVAWNGQTRKVTINGNDTEIILSVGSNTALVNGKEVNLDTTVYLKASEGRVYLPVRFITENMGCTVEYARQNNVNIIKITSKNGTTAGAIAGNFHQLTAEDDAKMRENMELVASLIPVEHLKVIEGATGNAVLYGWDPKTTGFGTSLLTIGSATGMGYEASIKPMTWTVPGLEQNEIAKSVVRYTKEALMLYLPNDWKIIYDIVDSRKADRTKTYICDNRAVKIIGNDILIGFVGQKTIENK